MCLCGQNFNACWWQGLGKGVTRIQKMLSREKPVNAASLQTHQVNSTLKRRGKDRFHVVSTWSPRDVFVGLAYWTLILLKYIDFEFDIFIFIVIFPKGEKNFAFWFFTGLYSTCETSALLQENKFELFIVTINKNLLSKKTSSIRLKTFF